MLSRYVSCSVTLNETQPELCNAEQIAAANRRFGEGVTREVGMDFKNMKARKACAFGSDTNYGVLRRSLRWRSSLTPTLRSFPLLKWCVRIRFILHN